MSKQHLSSYLGFLLASAHRELRAGMSHVIDDEDFTEEHWRILHVLTDGQGHSMGELAEQVLMNGPALTKNIDRLVSRGLVQRAADGEDSRKVIVSCSDHGLKVTSRLQRRVNAHHVNVEEVLGARKTAQLKKLLGDFISKSRLQ